jgi:hypothetical protein
MGASWHKAANLLCDPAVARLFVNVGGRSLRFDAKKTIAGGSLARSRADITPKQASELAM